MHADTNLLSIEYTGDDVVFHVHEQRGPRRKIRRTIQVQQPRERPSETTRVEHEPRPVGGDLIACLGGDHRTLAGRIDGRDLDLVTNRGPSSRGLVRENLVELRALDLERVRKTFRGL